MLQRIEVGGHRLSAIARSLELLMLRGLGEIPVDRLFAQCLACFEPMQTMYEDEAITIRPDQDGYLLYGLWFERCAAFYRHVDVRDRKFFSPHHGTSPQGCQQHATKGNNLSLLLILPEILEPIRRASSAVRVARTGKRPGRRQAMSEKGQVNKPEVANLDLGRRFAGCLPMSALPPIADIRRQECNVCVMHRSKNFVICSATAQRAALLTRILHFVRAHLSALSQANSPE